MNRKVFKAAESGDLKVINGVVQLDLLLTRGGNTVLHVAVRFEQKSFAEQALEQCPSLLNKPNRDGETPLHAAAKNRDPEMAALLLRHAASADVESQAGTLLRARSAAEGDTALHVAVRCGHTAVAKLLIDADAALLEALNHDNESPLFLAVEGGFLDIAECIIEKPCGSLSERVCEGSNGMNALHAAVIRSHHAEILENHVPDLSLEKLRRIIRNFVLHIEEYFGIFSPKRGKELIETLLLQCEESQRTCLVRKQDNLMNWTPLHFAACLGHLEATKLILEKNPTCVACLKDNEGMSALLVAAKEGHIGVMEEIICHNPEACEVANNRGWNVLHVAVSNEKLGVVKYILRSGQINFKLLLNVADKEGNTPLHLAVGRRKVWIMKALVDDIRVDKRATNLKGLRPIDILRTNADIGEFMRTWLMKKLRGQGGLESLGSIVHRVEHSNHSDDSKPTNDTKNTVAITSDKATRSDRLKEISNTHLLVATLIATVTYAAAFTVPGGFKSDAAGSGMAMLAERPFFKAFVVADSVAFYCASASVLLQFLSSVEHNYHLLLRFTTVAAILTYVSIFAMAVAFTSGLRVVMPASSMLAVYTLVMGAFCLFLFTIGCL